ncbi:hypothetical protein BH10ACI1_BH10ACI1_11550 [soil metagenome]
MEIMDFEFRIANEAAQRWAKREVKREIDEKNLKNNQLSEVEPPERIAKNLQRMTNALVKRDNNSAEVMTATIDESGDSNFLPKTSILDDISKERIIGNSDLMGIEFF